MYLDDVRENRYVEADGKNEKISYWRMYDNRKTTKYQWGAYQLDLDELSPEDYAKTIFNISGNTGGGGEATTYVSTFNYKTAAGDAFITASTAEGSIPVAPEIARKPYSTTVTTEGTKNVTTYTLSGWNPPLAAATADTSYNAVYTAKVDTYYEIKFNNYDSKNLKDDFVASGSTPSYEGTPSRTSTYSAFTFAGWDSTIVPASEPKTYTATYTYTIKNFNVAINGLSNETAYISTNGSEFETYDASKKYSYTALTSVHVVFSANTGYYFEEGAETDVTKSLTTALTITAPTAEKEKTTEIYIATYPWISGGNISFTDSTYEGYSPADLDIKLNEGEISEPNDDSVLVSNNDYSYYKSSKFNLSDLNIITSGTLTISTDINLGEREKIGSYEYLMNSAKDIIFVIKSSLKFDINRSSGICDFETGDFLSVGTYKINGEDYSIYVNSNYESLYAGNWKIMIESK